MTEKCIFFEVVIYLFIFILNAKVTLISTDSDLVIDFQLDVITIICTNCYFLSQLLFRSHTKHDGHEEESGNEFEPFPNFVGRWYGTISHISCQLHNTLSCRQNKLETYLWSSFPLVLTTNPDAVKVS